MTASDPVPVLAPLHAYVVGHATGDPTHFRQAFLPTAHIEGIREGAFVSWDLDEYCASSPVSRHPTRGLGSGPSTR